MYKVEHAEPTWITRSQFGKLVKALPPHLADMARFSVATGLRMRNVTHLTWDRVDLKRRHVWIPGSRAKGGKPIPVPLNADAVAIMKRWKGKHEERVFIFRGKPIDDANGATFKAAAASVGLPALRWLVARDGWNASTGAPGAGSVVLVRNAQPNRPFDPLSGTR